MSAKSNDTRHRCDMRVFSLLALSLGTLLSASAAWAGDLSASYSWKPMKIGGGGWVVGMDIHPTEKDLMYVRTDVSGGYRWDPASSSWIQVVTAQSLPPEYVKYSEYRGVDSIVAAPSEPDVAYMAYQGQIFRSKNRGDTWTATSFAPNSVKMEPNGDGRQEGERLAVDPGNSDVVYYGSIQDRLWRTDDAGATWHKVTEVPVGQAPHGVNTVVFDKTGGMGAIDDKSKTKVLYVTVDKVGVYQSADAGVTWTPVGEGGPGAANIRDAEVGPDGTYYVVSDNTGGAKSSVWKRSPAGKWQNITPSVDKDGGDSLAYWDMAVNPLDAKHIAVIVSGGKSFISKDQGETWTVPGFQRKSADIPWLSAQNGSWLSVGEIIFDPVVPGRLWFAEGFGVWRADDLAAPEISWQAESAGIEETCGNDIISPPGGKPLGAMWDLGVVRFSDPDAYTAHRVLPYFMSAWALDWCPADPKFIAGIFRNHLGFEPHVNEAGYSTDGGVTWTIFPAVQKKEAPKELEYGVIAVSANSPDKMVWTPANAGMPYYTADRGVSWAASSLGSNVTSSGFGALHSGQKPLCGDRVLADTFYLYHWGEGFFRSMDGGASFQKTKTSPALNRYNAIVKSVPGHAGHVLFAEGSQGAPVGGIWQSKDGGATWAELPFIEQAFNLGLGKAKDPDGYPTIFVAGVARGETGIYRSTNAGANWDKIGEYPLGIFDWVDAMDGDKDAFGRVFLAFTSAGFAYGEEKK